MTATHFFMINGTFCPFLSNVDSTKLGINSCPIFKYLFLQKCVLSTGYMFIIQFRILMVAVYINKCLYHSAILSIYIFFFPYKIYPYHMVIFTFIVRVYCLLFDNYWLLIIALVSIYTCTCIKHETGSNQANRDANLETGMVTIIF